MIASPQKVAGMRVLYEELAATEDQIAAGSGYKLRTVKSLVRRLGWKKPPATARQLTARVNRSLEKRAEQLIAQGESGHKETQAAAKARTDELLKIHNALRASAQDGAGEPQQEQGIDDAELAKILQRIDERIHELAAEFAADMVAGLR